MLMFKRNKSKKVPEIKEEVIIIEEVKKENKGVKNFRAITDRAKEIRSNNPTMKWKDAIKQSAEELKSKSNE